MVFSCIGTKTAGTTSRRNDMSMCRAHLHKDLAGSYASLQMLEAAGARFPRDVIGLFRADDGDC